MKKTKTQSKMPLSVDAWLKLVGDEFKVTRGRPPGALTGAELAEALGRAPGTGGSVTGRAAKLVQAGRLERREGWNDQGRKCVWWIMK